jgi:hypothetical protein
VAQLPTLGCGVGEAVDAVEDAVEDRAVALEGELRRASELGFEEFDQQDGPGVDQVEALERPGASRVGALSVRLGGEDGGEKRSLTPRCLFVGLSRACPRRLTNLGAVF